MYSLGIFVMQFLFKHNKKGTFMTSFFLIIKLYCYCIHQIQDYTGYVLLTRKYIILSYEVKETFFFKYWQNLSFVTYISN